MARRHRGALYLRLQSEDCPRKDVFFECFGSWSTGFEVTSLARRNQLPTSRKVGFGETTPVRSRQLRALLDAPLSLHDVRKDIVDSRQMARSLGLQPFQHVAPDEPVDLLAKPSQRFCAVRLNLRAGLNLPLPEFVPFASEPAAIGVVQPARPLPY